MLEYQLDSLDGVDESVQSMYTEKDGKFVLGINGLPDVKSYEESIGKMEAKLQELLGEKKAEAEKRRVAEAQARKEAEEAAKRAGDTDALERSWQEKYDAKVTELTSRFEPEINKLQGFLSRATVESDARKIVSEIALQGSEDVLMPHVMNRLQMQIRDDGVKTVVLGKDGKPSALSIEELKNEFIGNAAFAPVIRGSQASGGSAEGSNASGGKKTLKMSVFQSKSPSEQMAFVKDGGTVIDD